MAQHDDSGGPGFFTGFLMGGIFGFVAGVLFAPKPGDEIRSMIVERGTEWRDRAEELAAMARERANSVATESRRAAQRIRGEMEEFEPLDGHEGVEQPFTQPGPDEPGMPR
jgi:gas vesicle protein